MTSINPRFRKKPSLSFVYGSIGLLVAFVGIVVIIGWFIHSPVLMQISPNFAVMQFNTALMFVLSGLALFLGVLHYKTWAIGIGIAVLVFCGATLSQFIFDISLGLDELFIKAHTTVETSHPGRMAPNTAICFMLTGLSVSLITIEGRWQKLTALSSTLIFSIAFLAIYGYLSRTENAYGWGNLTRMAVHTAICFSLLGAALLAEIWRLFKLENGEARIPNWFPITCGMGAFTLGLCAWNSVVMLRDEQHYAELLAEGKSLADSFEANLESEVLAMGRMGDRWEKGVHGAVWRMDATRYVTDINGLQKIVFINSAGEIKQAIPDILNLPVEWDFKHLAKSVPEFKSRESVISGTPFSMPDSFVVAIKVKPEKSPEFAGTLVGIFDLASEFENIRKFDLSRFGFQLTKKDGSIIAGKKHPQVYRLPLPTLPLKVGTEEWLLTVYPHANADQQAPLNDWLSILTLAVSAIFAILVGSLVAFAQRGYHSDLIRTDEEIRQVNSELETMLYIVAHDLKDPLRSINSFAELLEEDCYEALDEGGRDLLQRIQKSGHRMDALLEDVTTASRAQRLEIPNTIISLEVAVQGQIDDLQERILESKAKVKIEDGLASLRADEIWVGHSINNLIGNALKFVKPSEAPDIEIAPYSGPEGIGLVVKDRGTGLPENTDDRIFDIFQRGVSRKVPGTGVGLAIVKKVAQKHRGTTWFSRRNGGGTEFYVTFCAKST